MKEEIRRGMNRERFSANDLRSVPITRPSKGVQSKTGDRFVRCRIHDRQYLERGSCPSCVLAREKEGLAMEKVVSSSPLCSSCKGASLSRELIGNICLKDELGYYHPVTCDNCNRSGKYRLGGLPSGYTVFSERSMREDLFKTVLKF